MEVLNFHFRLSCHDTRAIFRPEGVIVLVRFGDLTMNPAGDTHGNDTGGNIPGDNASCANDAAVTDVHAGQNSGSGA